MLLNYIKNYGFLLFSFFVFVILATMLATMNSFSFAVNNQKKTELPNVFLLTVDTLRADHLGIYGYSRNTSPNIDKLAKRGVLFKRAMCNWPKTTPSFASMLTGTYGSTNKVRGGCRQKLPLKWTTIAEALENNGYHTAGIVNNANLGVKFQFNQGFKDFIEIWEKPEPDNCVTVTDYAIKWLKENHEKHFFLWVHYVAPHAKYEPAAPYNEMFLNDVFSSNSQDNILPIIPYESKSYRDGIRENVYLEPHNNLNYYISQYDGEIAYVDSQIKRLIDEFDNLNLFNKTLTIFTSDHGEELGEHNIYFEHGTAVYQTTMHVPLVFIYPGRIGSDKIIYGNNSLIDIFPTILDYCGVKPIVQFEGRSLRSAINGSLSLDETVFSEGGYRNRKTKKYHSVLYKDDWKIIHKSTNDYELYNLANDPKEQSNLIEIEKEKAKMLIKELSLMEKREDSKKEKITKPPQLSEKSKKQLRSLGYME
jgi:arylsulfatase A-like enzyme